MIWDQTMETLDRARLGQLQQTRLSWTMNWARERVPFYRDRIPDRTRATEREPMKALLDLPLTHKSDLRDHYPLGLLAVPRSQVRRFHASSGTRGKPTVVAYTERDLAMWAEIVARSIAAAGGEPGHTLHNAYGYGLFTGGLGLHSGAERLGVAVVPASGGSSERQIQLLVDLKPDGLACTPSYALHLAETLRSMGLGPSDLTLSYGIFGAEPWTDHMRERLEEALGLSAVDIYGLSELTGPGVAMECAEGKKGLHVFEDFFYVEVIDPDTGTPVPDGETGELVLTTLSREAMPMVRYATGDLVSRSPEPCVCGRTFHRISRIKGRVDDMLVVRGVNVFPSEIERVLLSADLHVSPHYQLVWEGNDANPSLVVEVEAGGDQFQEREVKGRLKDGLNITLEVRQCARGSIPRSQGKAVRVIDRRLPGEAR